MGTVSFIKLPYKRNKAGANKSSLHRSLDALLEGRSSCVGYSTEVGEPRSGDVAQCSYQQQSGCTELRGHTRPVQQRLVHAKSARTSRAGSCLLAAGAVHGAERRVVS